YTTAYNSFIDLYGKNQRKNQILDELKDSMAKENLGEPDSNENHKVKKVKMVIDQLPPKCREIILLNKTHGLKYKEIAVIKNISEKTVESQMRIAFAKIREAFDDNDSFLFLLFS